MVKAFTALADLATAYGGNKIAYFFYDVTQNNNCR